MHIKVYTQYSFHNFHTTSIAFLCKIGGITFGYPD